MLQWMGGSRKKVVTSRKSTHNRQKQYFEQRKRQRQAPGNENCADSNDKQVNCNAKPRSLDILNLINLGVASQKASTELTISPVDPHVSKFLDTALLGKLPCNYSTVPKESGSEQLKNSSDSNILGVGQPQDLTDSYICSSYVNGPKMPVSITEHTSSQLDGALNEKNENPQIEVTVLDLLGDDGPCKVSNRKSIPEAHVAFSVEGLGKIGTRTPAHSPTLQNRFFCKGLSSASKASRHSSLSSTLESSHYELNEELNAMMDDFRVSPLCYKGGQLDDVGAKSPTCKSSVSLMSPDSREDLEKISIKDGFGYLEKQLNEESSDAASHNQRFYMDCHSLKSNSKKHEKYTISDFEVGDTFLPSSRNLWEGCKIFDASETSTTPDFFNMERGHVTSGKESNQSFTWESDVINADEMLDPVSWNFLPTEDSQDNASLSSEDSNSFNAVRNKNSLNFGAQSMKHGKNKKKLKEMFQMNSGEMSFLENLYQDRNIFTRSTETAWGKEKKCSSQFRTLGDENNFLPGQLFPSKAASAPDPFNSLRMGKSTRSSGHKALYQDDLFDLFPMPKYKFEIPSGFEPSSDFIYQREMSRKQSPSDFHSKTPIKHSSKLNGHVQHSSSGGGFCKNIHFTHLPKYQDDNEDRGSSGKPQPDDYEKRSTSSVNAESPTGTDNLSRGNEHEESKGKLPESSDTQKAEYSHDEAEVIPTVVMEEVPSQLQNYVHGKLNQFQGGSPVPSHLSNEESKETCGPETQTVQSDAGGSGDASYQVMLQSYVLQLLCVQKVLWEASGKDIKKKV